MKNPIGRNLNQESKAKLNSQKIVNANRKCLSDLILVAMNTLTSCNLNIEITDIQDIVKNFDKSFTYHCLLNKMNNVA
jgi:hypothetical protein